MEAAFADYSEALDWMEQAKKNYKPTIRFYASDEFKAAYPLISQLYDAKMAALAQEGMAALAEAGLKIGDEVVYDAVSLLVSEEYRGKVVRRKGIPYVKLYGTLYGTRRFVRWHRGFSKMNDTNGGNHEKQ